MRRFAAVLALVTALMGAAAVPAVAGGPSGTPHEDEQIDETPAAAPPSAA